MKSSVFYLHLTAVLLIAAPFMTIAQRAGEAEQLAMSSQYLQASSRMFEENKGQVTGEDASKVNFTFKDRGLSIFLLQNGLAYQFSQTHYPEGYMHLDKFADARELEKMKELTKSIRVETYRMDVTLVDANPNPRISTEGKSSDCTQYYNHDALDVHHYAQITYHNVYEGIDWVIYRYEGGVKYDFVVHPGADPNQIQLQTNWVEAIKLNEDGSLTLRNRMGSVTEQTPVSYQGERHVTTHFVVENNLVSFELGDYDHSQILIVDPNLQWATYYGEIEDDKGHSCTVDGSGNVYLAGQTLSTSAIASGGYQNTYGGGIWDAYLVKFNSDGVRQWATYYGGVNAEIGYSCAVDGSENVYLAGQTASNSNIASGGHQNAYGGSWDAFLVKFNSSGIRQWATYYGGTSADFGHSCAVDGSGNVYLVGQTSSTSAIASGGHQTTFGGGINDGFLVKFNGNGVRQWATYYGGNGFDEGFVCAADGSENVYLAGRTTSSTNIASEGHQNTYAGSYDAFLVKFNANGVRQWGTYYGGDSGDNGRSCAVDGSDNVYLAGFTYSTSDIASGGHQNTHGGAGEDGFLVKFNSSGVRQWATYYGGTSDDTAFSCAVDASDNVYLAGVTGSTSAIASDGHQNTLGGNWDAYLVKFNASGIRQWGTYYGGSGIDRAFACAVDAIGNVYLSGETQSTSAISLDGHQNSYGGGVYDAFLAKFGDTPPCIPSITISSEQGTTLCEGQEVIYTATITNGGENPVYQWKRNGSNVGTGLPTYTSSQNSNGDVITCELTSDEPCALPAAVESNTLTVEVNLPVEPTFDLVAPICAGETLSDLPMTSNNGIEGSWSPSVDNTATTTYTFTPSENQCASTTSLTVEVNLPIEPTFDAVAPICAGETLSDLPMTSNNGIEGSWSPSVDNTATTTYTFTPSENQCANTTTLVIEVNALVEPTFDLVAPICAGETLSDLPMTSNNGIEGSWSPSVDNTATTTYTFTPSENQCASTSTLVIEVNPTPTVSIALNGEVLEATSGFVSYSWTFNGAALQGANSAELTPTANGLYTVTVTDANGCGAEASFNYTGVGVGEEARIFVNLYPNPTNGLLNLTFVDARAREVVVYDNTGKRVHQSVVYGAHERIDLSFLAVGSYHLHVSQGEERLHRVIVVTR